MRVLKHYVENKVLQENKENEVRYYHILKHLDIC